MSGRGMARLQVPEGTHVLSSLEGIGSGERACSSAGQSTRLISVGSVVQIYPGPPCVPSWRDIRRGRFGKFASVFGGGLAQLGERLVCNQEVTGSSPVFSTRLVFDN